MKDVGLFYRHLFAFTVVCYILWTFGIVRGNLAYFYQFGYFVPRKNLATLHTRAQKRFKVKFGIQLIVMFVGKKSNRLFCRTFLCKNIHMYKGRLYGTNTFTALMLVSVRIWPI
jgi:hypothetical protein